jgi:hypothetical protein
MYCLAQKLLIDTNDLNVEVKAKPFEHKIRLYVKDVLPNKSVHVVVTDRNSGTAVRIKDYYISSAYHELNIVDTGFIAITIQPDEKAKAVKTVRLNITATYDGVSLSANSISPTDSDGEAKLKISPMKEDKTRKLYKLDSANFRILTAGSLNFYGKQQFAKFVAQMDIRLPSLIEIKKFPVKAIGVNAGIFTKNYYADSIYRGVGTFKIRNGNDTLTYNSKMIERSANIVYDIYGAYINPTFLLIQKDKANGNGHFRLYFNLSAEVLSTTAKTSYRYTTRDSTIKPFNSEVNRDNVLSPKDPRIIQSNNNENWITGFYGGGLQMYYNQDDLLDFNFLVHYGKSVTSYNKNRNIPLYNEDLKTSQPFYFFKGVVTERVTKLNATLGVEVRGMFPRSTPSIAAYVGVLISPTDFFKK